jgi:hypothetical protein
MSYTDVPDLMAESKTSSALPGFKPKALRGK